MRKFICLLLSGIIFVSATSCKNTGDNENVSREDTDYEHFYIAERMADIAIDEVLDYTLFENKLMLTGIVRKDILNGHDTESETITVKTICFDIEGKQLSDITLKTISDDPYRQPSTAAIDKSGYIWLLYNDYSFHEQTLVSEYLGSVLELFDNTGNHMKSLFLGKLSSDMLFNMKLIIGHANSIFIFSDGITATGGFTTVFDEDGTYIFELDRMKGICELSDERIIAKCSDITGENISFYEIDIEKKNLGEEFRLDSSDVDYESYYTSGNSNFEMLELTSTAIYGYNLINETRVLIAQWAKHGMYFSGTAVYRYVVMTEENILCMESSTEGKITLVKLTRTDTPDTLDITEKTVITIASLYNSQLITNSVNEFNRIYPYIDMQVKVYQRAGQSINDALTALNLDLIAGDIPDIILISSVMPFESYANKGLFVDLYEFIDNDPDIKRDDYLNSVFRTLEADGKLYAVVDSFVIDTVIGRVSDVGTDMGWTWDDFNVLMERKPKGTIPISSERVSMTREDFFLRVFSTRFTDFVNFGTGTCDFENQDFISLMEAAAHYYPAEANYPVTVSDFLQGSPVLICNNISSFGYYQNTRYESYLGEEFSYIGFPAPGGESGSRFMFDERIAISDKSDNKDVAWEYVKYILTDYQYGYRGITGESGGSLSGFPIKLSALEEYAEKTLASFDKDQDGFYSEGLWIRNVEERDIDKILTLINSIDSYRREWDYVVNPIVREEVSSFFAGQKSASAAAAVIQSRVSIYLAEQS